VVTNQLQVERIGQRKFVVVIQEALRTSSRHHFNARNGLRRQTSSPVNFGNRPTFYHCATQPEQNVLRDMTLYVSVVTDCYHAGLLTNCFHTAVPVKA